MKIDALDYIYIKAVSCMFIVPIHRQTIPHGEKKRRPILTKGIN